MSKTQLAFIGGGNMASSLIGGLIATGWPADAIKVSEPSDARQHYLRQAFGIEVASSNEDVVREAECVIMAVKPQQFSQALAEAAKGLKQTALLISVAAGVTLSSIEAQVAERQAVVRAMPNTPALIQKGMSGLYANDLTSAKQRALAESILSAVGHIMWVTEEGMMDAVTAVSGSGPAYYFLLMEAIQKAAVNMGFSESEARILSLETAAGAAELALGSSDSVSELRKKVTSPGGTTEAAITTLEAAGFSGLVQDALETARLRSIALSKA